MHRIVKRKRQPNKALLMSLFQSSLNLKTAATEYGVSREKQARKKFAKKSQQ